MRTIEDFPRDVRDIENSWVPLPDGTRLAARIWRPADAETQPVPAILEYLPYRKRDFTRMRDEPLHHYLAGHGYACLRVDLRGSGDSDGILTDEYTAQEHQDAVDVIRWAASQPWCTGAVGMMGISWGGFNALQVAALRPSELKAIITLCASDDRYADDAHFMGGCLLNENLTWGSVLLQFNSFPPDPEISGDEWRTKWLQRLRSATFFPAHWLAHQRRDAYWKHGSVCEDPGAIRCAVYAIGGWADAYSNAVPRLLEQLTAPRKGLIGPWSHAFPHASVPGPSIGFLQEALRWWDHWLKGHDTGIMDEPLYRVWMQDYATPAPSHGMRPGRWVGERSWPSDRIRVRRFAINAAGLGPEPEVGLPLTLRSLETTGLCAGDWCAFGSEGEHPTDQRRDDGTSLVFDSEPRPRRLEMLGSPGVELRVSADTPDALLAVRLNDVAPDGSSLRVSYGLLNLTHRNGHERVDPLEPGKQYSVRISLNDAAHAFAAGHVLRLSVSTAYWPVAWPSPAAATVKIYPGLGFLDIPVRPPDPGDSDLRGFPEPQQAPVMERTALRPGRFKRTVERDLKSNETIYTIFSEEADFEGAALARLDDIDLDLASSILRRYRITERDPLSARAQVEQTTRFRRGPWSVTVRTSTDQTATKDHFRIRARLSAYEGENLVYSRQWDEQVRRDGV